MKVRWRDGGAFGLWHHAKTLELTDCGLTIPSRHDGRDRQSTVDHTPDPMCRPCFPYTAGRTPAVAAVKTTTGKRRSK